MEFFFLLTLYLSWKNIMLFAIQIISYIMDFNFSFLKYSPLWIVIIFCNTGSIELCILNCEMYINYTYVFRSIDKVYK